MVHFERYSSLAVAVSNGASARAVLCAANHLACHLLSLEIIGPLITQTLNWQYLLRQREKWREISFVSVFV